MNDLWQKMLSHRSVVRQSTIDYAVSMGVDENEEWRNPFRYHLDTYDDALLSLQKRLTENVVSAIIHEHAPNVEVDSDAVLNKMVESLTDEDTETTTYDKPLVFDSEWIREYVQKNYIEDKDDVAYDQMLSRIVHMIGSYYLKNVGRDSFEQNGVIIIPFYLDKWFREKNSISSGTISLLREFDKLIQVLVEGENASEVEPRIFSHHFNNWSMWRNKLPSNVLFKKTETIGDDLPVDWFKPKKGKSEIEIHFKNADHAAKVADVIYPNTHQ